jgi:Tfp pilus assembly protein PilN
LGIDLKKEIKLSDLVPRRRKGAENGGSEATKPPKRARENGKGSGLRKEIKLSDLVPRRRKAGAGESAEEEKAPKPARQRRSFRRGPGKPQGEEAPAAVPAVPPTAPLMRAFNLMPRDEPRQGRGGAAPLPQIGLAVLGLLLVVALGAAYLLMGARVSEKQNRADELRGQLAAQGEPAPSPEAPPQGETDPALEQESQARTAALADALAGRVAWDRVLREFSLVVPDNVSLTTVTSGAPATDSNSPPADPAVGPKSLTITGLAPNQAVVALLLSRLSVLPELDTVQLQTSTREDSAYNFSIVATVAAPGAAS